MKITELKNEDIGRIRKLISSEPEVCLFISGDLFNFGIDGINVKVFGTEDNNGNLTAILLKYMSKNYVFYANREDFDAAAFASWIKKDNPSLEGVCLSGKASLIHKFADHLLPLKEEETMMARCNSIKAEAKIIGSETEIRLLKKDDFDEMWKLEQQIEEFASTVQDCLYEDRKKSFTLSRIKGSVSYGVFVNGKMVAVASTTADTDESSMLVGVCTHPSYRKKGYASAAVHAVLKDRFARGEKFLCLFYDNPEAGKIYRGFGFDDVSAYLMLH